MAGRMRGLAALVLVLIGMPRTCGAWLVGARAQRLVSTPAVAAPAALPPASLALKLAAARNVAPPFERQPFPGGRNGDTVVVLPERSGANNNRGVVEVEFTITNAAVYYAWLRVRWSNSCGNSCGLRIDALPAYLAGQDAVFNDWHWVRAGRYRLAAGTHSAALLGREDGVALDELLLVPDESFVPRASACARQSAYDPRRVADDFDRSPGHGLEPWKADGGAWNIAFTLDPNRIPDQYALLGGPAADGAPGMLTLEEPPWAGFRLAFSYEPIEPGEAGTVIECGAGGWTNATRLTFHSGGDTPPGVRLHLPDGRTQLTGLGDILRPRQWHRIVVERWAWVLRVYVDGRPVLTRFDLLPRAGTVGFCALSGKAAFDDVAIEEIPWQAEDGGAFTVPWTVDDGAEWTRLRPAAPASGGLAATRGGIRTRFADLPVLAVLLDEPGEPLCAVENFACAAAPTRPGPRLLEPAAGTAVREVRLAPAPGRGKPRIHRLAVAYQTAGEDLYREGPYDFSAPEIEDPGDYLDFTPDEMRLMRDPAQADRLMRRRKTYAVVDDGGEFCAWVRRAGAWAVADGALCAYGPGTVRYWRDIFGSQEFACRLNLASPDSGAEVELYGGAEPGMRVFFGGEPPAHGTNVAAAAIALPADGKWHDVRLRVQDAVLLPSVDGREMPPLAVKRGACGSAYLRARGAMTRFDDVEFLVPRRRPGERLYAFDRRETDWWREGGEWIDHGGIACTLASQWISLVAPRGGGILWNKESFAADLLVSATLEENSEWLGWDQSPTHRHRPYDNICLYLAPEANAAAGYRLEVNSLDRTATVLYRNGAEVARVAQDRDFPMRYVGGHSPYWPRRNRIVLAKKDGLLWAMVNGVEVLRFADADPARVSRVGVGGYNTGVNFSRIEIRELPASTPAPPP